MQAQDNPLTGPIVGPPAFGVVPGHPQLIADAPFFAGMMMEEPWREAAGFMRGRVDIRIAGTDGEQAPWRVAIEPDAVHDPVKIPMMLPVRGRRAVAAQ